MPEWDPEIEVDAQLARALIDAQVPELSHTSIRQVATGWDNVVYLVDERWAFRFPQRRIAIAGVQREIEVLGRLAPNLPLPIPVPRFIGIPTDEYPWPWFGSAWLPGVELAESGLPDAQRVDLGAALGAFLRELHSARLSRLAASGLPVDPLRRGDMGLRVPGTRRRLDSIIAAGLWKRTAVVERVMADAAGLPPPSRTIVLHGDLHARHVLVDDPGHAAGVIDWGDVSLGDPSTDLSIAYGSFTGEARDALLDAYGPIDGITELRARVLAISLAAALLEYAHDRGMEPLRDESVLSLERAVA